MKAEFCGCAARTIVTCGDGEYVCGDVNSVLSSLPCMCRLGTWNISIEINKLETELLWAYRNTELYVLQMSALILKMKQL